MRLKVWLLTAGLIAGSLAGADLQADESDVIKADREALAEANASGDSSKILAAKEQLSDDLGLQQEAQRKDMEGIVIPLTPDGQGHFQADVIINGTIHASLIVDTGSPVTTLTSSFVQRLGLDPTQVSQADVELLNGKYKAAVVSLESLKVGDARAEDVSAAVILEDKGDVKEIGDGLLGLSFLSKFHFTIDQTGQKLILKKLE